MAEAICAGLGYSWGRLEVPPAVLLRVAVGCGALLGRQLDWRPGPQHPPHQQQQREQQEHSGGRQPWAAVGGKRPPPCSPGRLAAAETDQAGCGCTLAAMQDPEAGPPAEAAGASPPDDRFGAGRAYAHPAAPVGRPVDILELLLAAGHKLRELKEQQFQDVSYGQLRLALAHLGRLNPGPWDS